MYVGKWNDFQASAADDDDDDVDLFGEETEEEKKAAEERAASVKASIKKKECEFPVKSLFSLCGIQNNFFFLHLLLHFLRNVL